MLIGTVAVAAVLIAVVLVSISQVPQGLGQTIPYSLSYTAGEKLTYSLSISLSANGQQVDETGTMTMQIVSFDGDNYTINEATQYEVQGASYTNNLTEIVNKEGQLVAAPNLPPQLQSYYSIIQGSPGNSMFLNRTEIQVGQTIQIPISFSNATMTMTGTENVKVAAIENITVTAGTYKTFRLDISTSNFQVSSQGVVATLSFTGYVHMDYSTCRVVDFNLQGTSSAEGETVSITINSALTGDTTS